MLPTLSAERTNCLSSLIGVLSDPCVDPTSAPPFYVEQIDGVDIDKLRSIASSSDLSGKAYAERLIRSSTMEMMGDLELLINNGYNLVETVGEVCSNCDFTEVYIPGGGIKIYNAGLSAYGQIRITLLKVKANVTGDHVLRIDDGVGTVDYNISLVAGVVMPLNLNYTSQQKTVKVGLVDQTVGLAQISCPVKTSCGCGLGTTTTLIKYSGTIGGMDATNQYGFIGCANVGCSNDILMCELIRQAPNLFGLTLLYKVGEKINNGTKLTLRTGRVAVQSDEIKDTEIFRYMSLYRKRMYGTTQERGIRNVVNEYLQKRSGDNCIQCVSNYKTGYVTG